MAYGHHDAETTTYNAPGLAYDVTGGVIDPTGSNPMFVPMHLTTFNAPTTKAKLTTQPLIPFMEQGLSYGGQTTLDGARDLPKVTLEGYIDTPCTQSGGYFIPTVTIESQPAHWPEWIAMCFEGRVPQANSVTSGLVVTPRAIVKPRWFRDPFGRIFGDLNNTGLIPRPTVIDFSSTYVEGAPGRMNFQMVLGV